MKYNINILLFTLAFLLSCSGDELVMNDVLKEQKIAATYAPEPYELNVPKWLPEMEIPADNPLTKAGVALGRYLFYDPILSLDSTISCASCHLPELAFADPNRLAVGIGGAIGDRHAMSLVNVGFYTKGLFWDGRVKTLEEQALIPIEDHREMNENWKQVEKKLARHPNYPKMFREAFGIEYPSQITKELSAKAIAQFERILVSGQSRFDKIVFANDLDAGFLTNSEERGRVLYFFEESQVLEHPGCSHCHNGPLFTDNAFRNNGIERVGSLNDFPDKGFGAFTKRLGDNGKFRVPTLRNIELTAPYMHDGRFQTLEEVLDHYSSGGHFAENLDANILPFTLSARDKQDLINFLKMLTDTSFVNNPDLQNPFK
jgi:cytochrome c peroxidase